MTFGWARELSETGVVRLAEVLALKIGRGDVVALIGELGAGKTTFARALINAFHDGPAEVPSPTFSLQQVYDTPRLTLTHFDFYRLADAEEARELGFEEALERGAVIVEWPERAGDLLPEDRFEITLTETANATVRRVTVRGIGAKEVYARRSAEIMTFLDAQKEWHSARIRHLQGDASTRSYARLFGTGKTVLLMDAPRQPDGPPVRDGKPYSQIAHLAEDMRSFVALSAMLREAGLSAPAVGALDLSKGLFLVEDLGDRGFGIEVTAGRSQAELWRTAVDALISLRRVSIPASLPLPDGTHYVLPRRDRAAFEIEVELLLDWLWPALKGGPAPSGVRAAFNALWTPVIDDLLALPGGWFLRDYHSPNLLWLPERKGGAQVGIIDFQDALNEHFAFDLVSLLQDARVDVPEALERELFDYYCGSIEAREPDFDRPSFADAYAKFGAQRNTRLLGLWARLLQRDSKPQYLRHYPRTWGYLQRNLANPALAPLAAWYGEHFPPEVRRAALQAK